MVFSTAEKPQPGQRVKVKKILLSNLTNWDARQIAEAYAVRWQIELFFKEMKSFLGLSSYRFRDFKEVEGWVQACCIAFCARSAIQPRVICVPFTSTSFGSSSSTTIAASIF